MPIFTDTSLFSKKPGYAEEDETQSCLGLSSGSFSISRLPWSERGIFPISLSLLDLIQSSFCINSECNCGNDCDNEGDNVVYDFDFSQVKVPILCIC
jgi:hypothetical protein